MKKNFKNISVISTGSWVPTDLNKKSKIKNTYKILINDLTVDTFIGIHDFEKKKQQKIAISLSLDVNDNISVIEHKIENFVSYEHIVADIKSILKMGHIDLLETLGEKIVDLCFKDERVMTIKLKLEKLDVFKETRSVGIEIFRKKNSDNNSIKENLSKAD